MLKVLQTNEILLWRYFQKKISFTSLINKKKRLISKVYCFNFKYVILNVIKYEYVDKYYFLNYLDCFISISFFPCEFHAYYILAWYTPRYYRITIYNTMILIAMRSSGFVDDFPFQSFHHRVLRLVIIRFPLHTTATRAHRVCAR